MLQLFNKLARIATRDTFISTNGNCSNFEATWMTGAIQVLHLLNHVQSSRINDSSKLFNLRKCLPFSLSSLSWLTVNRSICVKNLRNTKRYKYKIIIVNDPTLLHSIAHCFSLIVYNFQLLYRITVSAKTVNKWTSERCDWANDNK